MYIYECNILCNNTNNYEIKTDGLSISINYIHNDDISKNKELLS